MNSLTVARPTIAPKSQYKLAEPNWRITIRKAADLACRPVTPLSEKILFFHIHKCGGTSLKHAIANCYKSWSPRSHWRDSVLWLHPRAANETSILSQQSQQQVTRTLLGYMLAHPHVKCAMGHFDFSYSAFQRFKDDWHFVTVLRNPVDRFFSEYFFRRIQDSSWRLEIPLEEFVKSHEAYASANLVVRQITEDDAAEHVHTAEAVQRTIDILRQFSLLGQLENLQGFAAAFESRFKYRLHVPHRNANANRDHPKDSPVTSKIRRQVIEMCEPDLAVYRRLFENNTYHQ